ncbi:MAG: VOC family protein [Gammaproteobacteria bacterium]|nr:VOC family protein [Gammaproteobacteria bacterium]
MSKVIGIGGVFFKSEDPASLCEWYRRWLGFDITSYGCAEFPQSDRPDEAFTVWTPFARDTKYMDPSRKEFMINLVVDDVDSLLESVREGGAEIVGGIDREPYGDFGWFIDPEGNKIELWKPKAQTNGE